MQKCELQLPVTSLCAGCRIAKASRKTGVPPRTNPGSAAIAADNLSFTPGNAAYRKVPPMVFLFYAIDIAASATLAAIAALPPLLGGGRLVARTLGPAARRHCYRQSAPRQDAPRMDHRDCRHRAGGHRVAAARDCPGLLEPDLHAEPSAQRAWGIVYRHVLGGFWRSSHAGS